MRHIYSLSSFGLNLCIAAQCYTASSSAAQKSPHSPHRFFLWIASTSRRMPFNFASYYTYPDLCILSPLSRVQYPPNMNPVKCYLCLMTHHLKFNQAHLIGSNIASLNGFIPPAQPFCRELVSISFSDMMKALSCRSVLHR